MRILFESLVPLAYATVWLNFCDHFGRPIAHYEVDSRADGRQSIPNGVHTVDIEIEELSLVPGTYIIDVCCCQRGDGRFDYVVGAVQVEVVPGSATPQPLYSEKWQAAAFLKSKARWLRSVDVGR